MEIADESGDEGGWMVCVRWWWWVFSVWHLQIVVGVIWGLFAAGAWSSPQPCFVCLRRAVCDWANPNQIARLEA